MPLRLGNDDADDDAEEDHQTGRAADDSTHLLVVNKPDLAGVQGRSNLVAPAALRVQVEHERLSDEVAGVVVAGYVRALGDHHHHVLFLFHREDSLFGEGWELLL